MKHITYLLLILTVFFASCQNQDWDFPDFDYQAVYFAHQYPVRTITLGEDLFPTDMDNEWKFQIMATTGGVYENTSDVVIDITVDNSMVDGMLFNADGNEIMAMPANYYELASDQIVIPEGSIVGGVEVQLTDAFFADTLAIGNNYVIPVRMTSVQNADSILSGVAGAETPRRGVEGDWARQPKDFTFYAVKYINPYHGYYLRRGVDEIEGKNGNAELDTTIVRREEFVVDDQVIQLTTQSLITVDYPVVVPDSEGNDIFTTVILRVNEDGSVTVSDDSDDYEASGSGMFVKDGEKNSWSNQDRDAIYLDFTIELDEMTVNTVDTLVLRNRGVNIELFSPVLE